MDAADGLAAIRLGAELGPVGAGAAECTAAWLAQAASKTAAGSAARFTGRVPP
jgi:hypothetical protein